MNRDYNFAPDGMEVLHIDTRGDFKFTLKYVKKPRMQILTQDFDAMSYEEKGLKAGGVRLEAKEVEELIVKKTDGMQGNLFNE